MNERIESKNFYIRLYITLLILLYENLHIVYIHMIDIVIIGVFPLYILLYFYCKDKERP